jgi:MFS family permease
MLLGLAASQGGVLLFAVGPSVAYIFAGRVWMGLGVGLSASAATAALVEFSPPDDVQRANSIATVAMGVGFALATLIGGALIQYGAYPMRLNFGVLLVVLVVLFIATWFVPSAGSNSMPSWHPGKISIDRNIRKPFTASTVAMSTGYALGAVVLSLGAQIARDVIGSGNAFVNGAAIALYALTGSIITLLAKRLAGKHAIILGSAANLCAMALLTLSSNLRSLPLFVAALTSAGIAYGLMFLGGYALINAHAPPDQRAGTLSAIYLVAYLLMGSIAIGLGKTATAWGLRTAVEVGSVLIATLGTLGGVLAMCYGNSSKGSL